MSSTDGGGVFVRSAERMVRRWSGVKAEAKKVPATETPRARAQRGASSADRRLSRIGCHMTATEVEEPRKRVPVLMRCDVLVVGAGPSGLSAALAARRAGADTILLERYGCFGGVITTVGMETLGWYRYEGTVDCEGIGREMERAAERMGGTTKWPYNDSECLDADAFKVVADKLVTDAGVRPLLHCMVTEVVKDEEGHIKGVITESKSGRQAVLAKRVIDCTGDADVAHLAGCPYTLVPKADRMGATTVFNASGVDKAKFLNYANNEGAKTYADWSKGTEWKQETTGKEEELSSPFLEEEFQRAQTMGVIPTGAAQGPPPPPHPPATFSQPFPVLARALHVCGAPKHDVGVA